MMRGRLAAILGGALIYGGALVASYGTMIGTASQAEAGVCYNLWYQRNAIFANRGYCFKGCGQRVWGRNCFGPHFGRLTSSQWRQVRRIQSDERSYGCPSCPQPWE